MSVEYEYLILFNQPLQKTFKPKSISIASLEKAKAEGKIIDYVLDERGVKVKKKLTR